MHATTCSSSKKYGSFVDAWKYEVTVSSSRVNTCSLLTLASFLNGVLEEAASPLLGPGVRGSRDGHYTTKYNLFLIHLWLKLPPTRPVKGS